MIELGNVGIDPGAGSSVKLIAPGKPVEMIPGQTFEISGELYAPDPSGSRAVKIYNSLEAVFTDYDRLNDGDEIYLSTGAVSDPRVGHEFMVGGQRGSIIVTAISIIVIGIVVSITAKVIISGITNLFATIRKTPVSKTKCLNGTCVVTAPDGTAWLVDKVTGEVIDTAVPPPPIIPAVTGLVIIGGATYATVKWVVPWFAKKTAGVRKRLPF